MVKAKISHFPDQANNDGRMNDFHYTLFDTALGRCGVAWGSKGLRAVSFAEVSDEATAKRLMRRAPSRLRRRSRLRR